MPYERGNEVRVDDLFYIFMRRSSDFAATFRHVCMFMCGPTGHNQIINKSYVE